MGCNHFPRHGAVLLTITLTALLAPLSAEQTRICPPVDLDNDCHIGLNDLSLLAHYWLADEFVCDPGYLDCDDLYDNGCEIHADNDLSNCGHCGLVCSLPHATSDCVAGACTVVDCDLNWANCDGNHDNGCERNLLHTTDCAGATSVGMINGNEYGFLGECEDVCVGPVSFTAAGSQWFFITLRDDGSSGSCPGMRIRAQLIVPPDANYDLFLHAGCSSALIDSSTSPVPGSPEQVTFAWPYVGLSLWLEVRYISADSAAAQCAFWQLKTYGGCPHGIP